MRNSVLALPAAQRLSLLDDDARALLVAIFADLAADARVRAQESWRRNKGPMALYWKCVGAYAEHIRRAVRRSGAPGPPDLSV